MNSSKKSAYCAHPLTLDEWSKKSKWIILTQRATFIAGTLLMLLSSEIKMDPDKRSTCTVALFALLGSLALVTIPIVISSLSGSLLLRGASLYLSMLIQKGVLVTVMYSGHAIRMETLVTLLLTLSETGYPRLYVSRVLLMIMVLAFNIDRIIDSEYRTAAILISNLDILIIVLRFTGRVRRKVPEIIPPTKKSVIQSTTEQPKPASSSIEDFKAIEQNSRGRGKSSDGREGGQSSKHKIISILRFIKVKTSGTPIDHVRWKPKERSPTENKTVRFKPE